MIMSSLATRIGKRIKMTVKSFQSDCRFSLHYAFLRLGAELGGRLGFTKLANNCSVRKNDWIFKYLEKNLNPVIEKYLADDDNGTPQTDAPVWVCWWTGEETAPPLVRQCIKSIRKNAGTHPVHLITKDNYRDFLEIPAFMLEKVQSGHMGFAHLADYIRVKLLAEHGGLWLDATMFCSDTVPESCFSVPMFTCKSPRAKNGYVSESRWVTFCLGGWKGNVFYRFLVDGFEEYWKTNPCAIDYLFFDYMILLAYERIDSVRRLLDELPENTPHRDSLQAAMNERLPASALEEVLRPDTVLYKLSWRETYYETTADGKKSIYAEFLNRQ